MTFSLSNSGTPRPVAPRTTMPITWVSIETYCHWLPGSAKVSVSSAVKSSSLPPKATTRPMRLMSES